MCLVLANCVSLVVFSVPAVKLVLVAWLIVGSDLACPLKGALWIAFDCCWLIAIGGDRFGLGLSVSHTDRESQRELDGFSPRLVTSDVTWSSTWLFGR